MFKPFNLFFVFISILIKPTDGNIYDKCVSKNHITITFDDGPHKNTVEFINILDKYNASGTFFVNMLEVLRNNNMLSVVKNIYNSKHTLASHGFSHAAMEKLNLFNKERELYDNELLFRQLFNIRPKFYRPPYFSYNSEVVDICNRFGYDIIVSNLNTDDWSANSSEEIYDNFLNKWNNASGHILLIHDYQVYNLVALEKIIQFAKQQNYEFVSITECLGMKAEDKYVIDNTYGPNLLNGVINSS